MRAVSYRRIVMAIKMASTSKVGVFFTVILLVVAASILWAAADDNGLCHFVNHCYRRVSLISINIEVNRNKLITTYI